MHQTAIDQWKGLMSLIETQRQTTDHPDAHAIFDAIHQHATEQTELMAQKKAEADALAAEKKTA